MQRIKSESTRTVSINSVTLTLCRSCDDKMSGVARNHAPIPCRLFMQHQCAHSKNSTTEYEVVKKDFKLMNDIFVYHEGKSKGLSGTVLYPNDFSNEEKRALCRYANKYEFEGKSKGLSGTVLYPNDFSNEEKRALCRYANKYEFEGKSKGLSGTVLYPNDFSNEEKRALCRYANKYEFEGKSKGLSGTVLYPNDFSNEEKRALCRYANKYEFEEQIITEGHANIANKTADMERYCKEIAELLVALENGWCTFTLMNCSYECDDVTLQCMSCPRWIHAKSKGGKKLQDNDDFECAVCIAELLHAVAKAVENLIPPGSPEQVLATPKAPKVKIKYRFLMMKVGQKTRAKRSEACRALFKEKQQAMQGFLIGHYRSKPFELKGKLYNQVAEKLHGSYNRQIIADEPLSPGVCDNFANVDLSCAQDTSSPGVFHDFTCNDHYSTKKNVVNGSGEEQERKDWSYVEINDEADSLDYVGESGTTELISNENSSLTLNKLWLSDLGLTDHDRLNLASQDPITPAICEAAMKSYKILQEDITYIKYNVEQLVKTE
eukprot:gene5712-10963_t